MFKFLLFTQLLGLTYSMEFFSKKSLLDIKSKSCDDTTMVDLPDMNNYNSPKMNSCENSNIDIYRQGATIYMFNQRFKEENETTTYTAWTKVLVTFISGGQSLNIKFESWKQDYKYKYNEQKEKSIKTPYGVSMGIFETSIHIQEFKDLILKAFNDERQFSKLTETVENYIQNLRGEEALSLFSKMSKIITSL
jgi:hypothetical protein